MSEMLKGKVALITGAAGGIGRGTALLFAAEGAQVVASDARLDGAEETAELIRMAGGEATAVCADISKPAEVEAMVAAAVTAYGRLDCAFNNAGMNGTQAGAGGKLTAEWPEEAFDRIIGINLKGTWLCMRAEINQMLRQGSGSIVNTASLAGLTGFRTTAGYAASKHAIVGMTKTAAIEYAPKIRVNCVCPGWIDTDMVRGTIAQHGPAVLARVPFGRVASPKELGEVVCWLSSDRASYATGGAFTIDGGLMAG
jgi:NAD(P)-dependent dehydrogenase (short-subunit alcohol dehydrogenase family)